MALSTEQAKFFADYIESNLGIIYSKDNYYQLEKRILDVSIQMNFPNVDALYAKAKEGIQGQMKMLILDLATNNETSFFRDAGVFKAIEDHVLSDPKYSGSSPQTLKIWCCATSTGQEVYTMAMMLNVWMRMNPSRTYTIYATDYSLRVLNQAIAGRYSQLEVQRGLPATMLVRHFHNATAGEATSNHSPEWIVNDYLKKNIIFKQQNLLDDFGPVGPFDMVTCRNVLIYQNIENKKKIISEIAKKMLPGAYLILGASESLMGLSEAFDMKQFDRAVFYKKK